MKVIWISGHNNPFSKIFLLISERGIRTQPLLLHPHHQPRGLCSPVAACGLLPPALVARPVLSTGAAAPPAAGALGPQTWWSPALPRRRGQRCASWGLHALPLGLGKGLCKTKVRPARDAHGARMWAHPVPARTTPSVPEARHQNCPCRRSDPPWLQGTAQTVW